MSWSRASGSCLRVSCFCESLIAMGLAVILKTPTVIAPFGDHVSKAFFTQETLAQTQDRAASRAKMQVVRAEHPQAAIEAVEQHAGPALVMLDRVYISEKALKDFLKIAQPPAALALSINASVEYTLPLQSVDRTEVVDAKTQQAVQAVVHDVVLATKDALPPAEDDPLAWFAKLKQGARPQDVPKREIVAPVRLPTIGEREKAVMKYPVTSTVVVSIEHWVHILWLNQIAFGIRWMELLRRKPLWGIWRVLSRPPANRFALMDRLVRIERGAQVHPSAYLSGSIIGAGAKIGARASVRNSIVGEGAIIEDRATVLNTVVGPRSLVMSGTFLVSNVIYPDATVGNNKLQVSLIGEGAYVNAWAGFVDAKFIGHIKVEKEGQLVSTERAFLGSCVGHRAKVGAKILIMPGREVPNDSMIVMRPDEVISRVPSDLPENTPLVRDDGTLVPLGQERRLK